MPPKAEYGAGAAPDDDDERECKRPKAASALEGPPAGASAMTTTREQQQQQQQLDRSSDILFLVLERQRHAAREARAAERRNEYRRLTPPCFNVARFGGDDVDGEQGAMSGGGWWSGGRLLVHDDDVCAFAGSIASERHADGRHEAHPQPERTSPLPADLEFLTTCASAARACKTWRSLAFRAADRATVSWEGADIFVEAGPTWWKSTAPRSRRPNDPVSLLRAFDGGVLRALCVRGEPDDPGRLRAFARALGVVALEPASVAPPTIDREDERAANALRGLKVVRIERPQALIHALAPARLARNLPAPSSLLSGLVHLELERWRSIYHPPDEDRAVFFIRGHRPCLRSLSVSVLST